MRIDSIDAWTVNMPLVYPFRTAFGNDAEIETIIIRIRSEGLTGWGESTPWGWPGYSSEFAAGALLAIERFLAPVIVGTSIASGEELQARFGHIKGNYFAKAALDSAWWDLYARLKGVPLYRALGGTSPTVTVGADFGVMDTIDELLDEIDAAIAAGFKRTKLKFRPGWDLSMLDAVRGRFPDHTIHVDCNSVYRVTDFDMLKHLDEYSLAMVEQPLRHDDLCDHAALAEILDTPICLDESITSVDRARKAAEVGACGWINIKPGRLGGLTIARQVIDTCKQHGIPCWVGGMLESALGGNQCLALATLDNIEYPCDVFPSSRFYSTDLSDPPIELSGPSVMQAQEVPGSGAVPDEGRIQSLATNHMSITPE